MPYVQRNRIEVMAKCYYCGSKETKEVQLMFEGDESGNPERHPMCDWHAMFFSGECKDEPENMVEFLTEKAEEAADCIVNCNLDADEARSYLATFMSSVIADEFLE